MDFYIKFNMEIRAENMEKGKYICDIHSLSANDGELYLWYGNEEEFVVFDCEELYKDLASIVSLVAEQNKEMQEYHKKKIKEAIKEL